MEVKGLSHRVAVKTGDEAGKEVGCDQDGGRWEAACHVSELARGCNQTTWGIRSITSLIYVLAVAEEEPEQEPPGRIRFPPSTPHQAQFLHGQLTTLLI